MGGTRQSTVSVVKVESAVYDEIDFKAVLEKSLTNLEENDIEIPKDGLAFVKPNVVMGASARSSVTTEPTLISSLIGLLMERGVRRVYVGDSPASYLKSDETFRESGMLDAITQAGGEFVDIDDPSERVSIPLPGSDLLESISVPRKALDSDHIINFGKLKTHKIDGLTCCVKNWVGLIPQDLRLQYHQSRLAKLVSELHKALPETLCLADAVIVGEGDGPDLSLPKYLGLVLASNDPVGLDSIAAELLGINRNDLGFAWTAHLDGVGEIERNRIRVIGPDISEVQIRVEKPVRVLYNRFPCNVVLGGLCDGCFTWFLGPAVAWERDGTWDRIRKNVGRPTFMLGFNAVDINFEKHLQEGPYFVIGDCTPVKYQNHPKTIFIRGCCPGPAIPETILSACKAD
ncbi:MAG: DUF362 domain-containing protein [Deltaproteobacteria bacterium]|nr:DUF362 domain-containing protein [Deltaproteobacteria bacterium]MBW2120833.1 DUF362 domain-containing protein [Deltaproteobacteria bacterium]